MEITRRAAPLAWPRRARAAAAVVALVLVAGLVPSPSSAQDGDDAPTRAEEEAARILEETLERAPEQPAAPDDDFVAVRDAEPVVTDAAIARLAAVDASAEAAAASKEAAAKAAAAAQVVTTATAARDAAKAELAEERTRLSDLTVRAYVTGGDVSGEELRAIVNGDTADPAAGRAVIFEQVLDQQEDITEQARADATTARKALAKARDALKAAKAEAATMAERAARRADELATAAAAHEEALADQARAQARLRAGGGRGPVPLDVAIIGLPRLTADDLATWFATSPYVPKVATPIEDYAAWFIAEGATEGIRGDIAFAQAVLETGGFANNDSVAANNFSGIGHCDSCGSGWTFPSPRLGVRAQIQLLKSYAVKKPEYVNDLVDRRLRGPAGCCETWGDLTTVWATDPTYGPKVMLIYSSMVDHALQRRALGLGFEEPAPVPEG